jgi:hypothetical protein
MVAIGGIADKQGQLALPASAAIDAVDPKRTSGAFGHKSTSATRIRMLPYCRINDRQPQGETCIIAHTDLGDLLTMRQKLKRQSVWQRAGTKWIPV